MAQPLRVDRGGLGIANVPLNNLLLGNGIAPLTLLAPGTNGYILTIVAGAPSWQPAGSVTGTVTSVSVVTANGLSGTVTNPTTTPAITLDISGLALAKLASIADQTILGNISGGSAAAIALTAAQAKTFLNLSGTNSGDVTLSGENYLSLSSQAITANAVNLSNTNVTGTLAAARFGALTGDVTNSAGSYATTIASNAVTYAKMQAVSTTSKLLGSSSTTTPVQEITVGSGLSLTGTTLTATGSGGSVTSVDASGAHGITVSGNPVTTSGTLAFDLSTNGVALDRLATIADQRMLGNVSGGTASVIALTSGQVSTFLGLGTLATQSGTFSGTSSGTNTGDQSGANPTATIGLSANNGVALTFMRSDASPVLGVTIVPVWTGLHSFNAAGIASTYTPKVLLENTTAATSGATLQQSASLQWLGHYWGTTATAADSTAAFTETLIPTSAAGRAPSNLTWQAGNGGTDMNTVMTLSNAGVLTATTFSGALSGNATTASSAAKWTTARNLANNSVDGSANVTFANKFIVQGTTDAGLSAAQFLGSLGTGIVKNTTTTGVLSIAVNSDLPVMTATVGGAVPTPPNNTTTFLRGDGTFAAPASGMTNPMTTTGDMIYSSDGSGTPARLAIGSTGKFLGTAGTTPAWKTLAGTANEITVTNSSGDLTLSTPQDIATASTPQFLRLGLNQAADATASLALTQTALHATSTDGLILQNTTAALVGQTQEYSPRLVFSGTAWKSNATAISETDKWSIENEPQSGAAATTANLVFQSSLAGGSYATKMTLTSAGALTTTGAINAGNLGSGVVTTSSGTFTTNALTANAVLFAASSTAVTGNGTKFTYDGTSVNNTSSDAGTTNVPDMFIAGHRSSGTPAAGFGSGILWTMKDATTNDINAAELKAIWTDAAHATSTSAIVFSGDQSTTFSEWCRFANGALTLGVAGTLSGSLKLTNATGSNAVTIVVPASPSAYTLVLPSSGGTVGNFMRTNGSGTLTFVSNANAQSSPSNPTGTTSAVGVMMGLAGSVTPNTSGQVMIIVSGDIANSNALGGCKVQIRYGTGTAPTNGASLVGTTLGGNVVLTSAIGANDAFPFSVQGVATGLTVATAYWIDIAVTATTAGTASPADISISAMEF